MKTQEVQDKELRLKLRLAQIAKLEKCQDSFLTFVQTVWPEFIAGAHIDSLVRSWSA